MLISLIIWLIFFIYKDSHWPIVFHGISIFIAALVVMGGVAFIEPVNKIIVPVLLGIVAFSFYWAIFLRSAAEGITYMFKPNWSEWLS